jgi:hypothetical protein
VAFTAQFVLTFTGQFVVAFTGQFVVTFTGQLVVTFTGQFHNKCPLIYLFKVYLNKSEYILEILYNIKMKLNCQLLLLSNTIAVYPITTHKDTVS